MVIKFPKLKRYELYAVIVSFVYLLFFVYYFLIKDNNEFSFYYFLIKDNNEFSFYSIGLFVIFFAILFNIRRMNLSPFVLWGFVVMGFMHMFGGSIYIFGERLYDVLSFGLINLGDEFVLLKYDQVIHFASTFFVAVALFEILSKSFYGNKKPQNYSVLYLVIIFAAFGIATFNEIIEFVPGYFWGDLGVGGYVNTILDLAFNFLGAGVGILFVSHFRAKEKN